jgi:xanthosine utilization system XapX-like protein
MNSRLEHPFRALQLAFGLTATLAGLDKFFNILTHWSAYLSPFAARMLPVPATTFLAVVGIIEIAVGVAILWAAPRIGAYAASAWLLLVAINLVLARYFDIAVRDVVMSLAAFTLARALELREPASDESTSPVVSRRTSIASAVMLAAILGAPSPASAAPSELSQQHTAQLSPSFTLRENMRKLWTDHVVWTRGYIVAAVAGTPDTQAAAARLMKNQEDMGGALATV